MPIQKIVFFLITCFISLFSLSHGQEIQLSGKIFDKKTSEPLAYAEISIKGKNIGTITNKEGFFLLSYPISHNDSILFTHLAYDPCIICFSDLDKNENTILLIPKTVILDEIIVSAQNVVSVLQEALITSRHNIKIPLRLETYYREFVKENQQYTKFADGIIEYDMDMTGSVDKLKTRVKVKQSRANFIKTETDKEINWDMSSPLDVGKALNPFLLNRLQKIIEASNQYKFQLKTLTGSDKKEQLEIMFNPKPNTQELLFEGTVLIDKESNNILSFSYGLEQNISKSAKEINLLLLKAKVTQRSSLVLFKFVDKIYQPFYCNARIEMKLWNKKKINETFSFLSDLLVTKVVDITSVVPISKKEAYKKKALYSLGNNYKSAFWENQNSIQLTSEEEKIIEQLK